VYKGRERRKGEKRSNEWEKGRKGVTNGKRV